MSTSRRRDWLAGTLLTSACAAQSSPTTAPDGTDLVVAIPQIDAALADAVSGSTLEVTATSIVLDGRALERLPRRGHIILPLAEALADGDVKSVEIVAAPDLTMDVVVDVLITLARRGVAGNLRAESRHGGDVVPLVVPEPRSAFQHVAVHVQHDRLTLHDGEHLESFPRDDLESLATRVQAAAASAQDRRLPTHVTVSFEGDVTLEAVAGAVAASRGLDCRSALPCQVRGVSLVTGHSWGGTRWARLPETKDCPVPEAPPGSESVRGSTDKDAIRQIVRCHIGEVRYCYNRGLLRDPTLAGRVTVQFNVSPEGKVAAAIVRDSEISDRNVANCIAKTVKTWTFPKPSTGGSAVITYPFVLNPSDSGVGESSD